MITLRNVRDAAARLDGVANRTPVLRSRTLDGALGAEIYVKAENAQRTGSFKFRGAYNKMSELPRSQLERGVIALSSGNHAQAVALAAQIVQTRATVLMPEDSPSSKLAATRAYGAEVLTFDRYAEDFDELLSGVAAERNMSIIHAFDDPVVMAGQGTAALELFQQVGKLDLLFASVGGGGLIAGCATVAKALHPEIHVVGVEPEAGNDVQLSLRGGHRVTIEMPRTVADGQQLTSPGERTFEVILERVHDIITANDDEIVQCMRFVFERMKAVVEPSGACALAALLAGKFDVRGRRVGVIVTGGNVDVQRFVDLLQLADSTSG